eukprot:4561688-Prymnesium_polylepis.1
MNAAPAHGDEDEERPVVYMMRFAGTSNMVWYDRVADTFTSRTPIYAIGVCLHGGRKREERMQATCGTGQWKLLSQPGSYVTGQVCRHSVSVHDDARTVWCVHDTRPHVPMFPDPVFR